MQPELANVIVRNVRKMLDHGAVVKKIESLGHNDFPFSLTKNGEKHYHGRYVANNFRLIEHSHL